VRSLSPLWLGGRPPAKRPGSSSREEAQLKKLRSADASRIYGGSTAALCASILARSKLYGMAILSDITGPDAAVLLIVSTAICAFVVWHFWQRMGG
jgi:hypothetical protein